MPHRTSGVWRCVGVPLISGMPCLYYRARRQQAARRHALWPATPAGRNVALTLRRFSTEQGITYEQTFVGNGQGFCTLPRGAANVSGDASHNGDIKLISWRGRRRPGGILPPFFCLPLLSLAPVATCGMTRGNDTSPPRTRTTLFRTAQEDTPLNSRRAGCSLVCLCNSY